MKLIKKILESRPIAESDGENRVGLEKVRKFGLKIVLLLFVVLMVVNSAYRVPDGYEVVVTQFGKMVKIEDEAGFKFRVPFIQKIEKVNVMARRKIEYGYKTIQQGSANNAPVYDSDINEEGYVVVGAKDNNMSIVDVEVVIECRVKDSYNFLYKVDDLDETIRILAERVIRDVFSSESVDSSLTQKDQIDSAIKPILQKALDEYEAGVLVTDVQIQNASLTPAVSSAYSEVEKANQYKKQKIEEASKYENKINQEATQAAKIVLEEAEGYASDVITKATEDKKQFLKLHDEYQKNPKAIKERLYMEAMIEFFNNNDFIIDFTDGNGIYKFFNMDDKIQENIKKTVVE